jgi:hypothetical protein
MRPLKFSLTCTLSFLTFFSVTQYFNVLPTINAIIAFFLAPAFTYSVIAFGKSAHRLQLIIGLLLFFVTIVLGFFLFWKNAVTISVWSAAGQFLFFAILETLQSRSVPPGNKA